MAAQGLTGRKASRSSTRSFNTCAIPPPQDGGNNTVYRLSRESPPPPLRTPPNARKSPSQKTSRPLGCAGLSVKARGHQRLRFISNSIRISMPRPPKAAGELEDPSTHRHQATLRRAPRNTTPTISRWSGQYRGSWSDITRLNQHRCCYQRRTASPEPGKPMHVWFVGESERTRLRRSDPRGKGPL